MKTATGYIYGIRLRGQSKFIYIGQTRQTIEARFSKHMRGKTPMSKFLQFYGSPEFFEVCAIEQLPVDQLNEREKYWIVEFETRHPKGLNHMAGGDAHQHTETSRRRMSEAAKLRFNDPDFAAAVKARNKSLWQDPQYRARQEAGRKEAQAKPQFREKISVSTRRLWSDPNHRKSMTQAAKSQWADVDQRALKTERLKRACGAEENRKRQAELRKAMWADPEKKAKQIAALRLGWAKKRLIRV